MHHSKACNFALADHLDPHLSARSTSSAERQPGEMGCCRERELSSPVLQAGTVPYAAQSGMAPNGSGETQTLARHKLGSAAQLPEAVKLPS